MAKVSFTKFNKIKTVTPKTVNINGIEVTILQYLPLKEKLQLIQNVIEQSGNNEEGFYNCVKLEVFYTIEMIRAYTNISFTEKQLEDIPKLYDEIVLNNVWENIKNEIPSEERNHVLTNIISLAREITNYNNSILGILKTISKDYDNLNFDADSIKEKLQDPNSLSLLKQIMKDSVG